MDIKNVVDGLGALTDGLSNMERVLNSHQALGVSADTQRKAEQNAAILKTAESTSRTAKATEALQEKVNELTDALEKERQTRSSEDDRIFKHTVKYDRLNFIVALIGAITGIVALVVSLIE